MREFTATALEPYAQYRLRVAARSEEKGWGKWTYSELERTIDFPSVPGLPTDRESYGTFNRINTVWAEWAAAATRYDHTSFLEYDVEVDGEVESTNNDKYKILLDVAPNATHQMRVRARNTLGPGDWSAMVAFTTSPAEVPAQPGTRTTKGEAHTYIHPRMHTPTTYVYTYIHMGLASWGRRE